MTFSVSFPGSSSSLGTQLHARKVTLDPSPSTCQPSPAQLVKTLIPVLGAGGVGFPLLPHLVFPTISLIPLRVLTPLPSIPQSPYSDPCAFPAALLGSGPPGLSSQPPHSQSSKNKSL